MTSRWLFVLAVLALGVLGFHSWRSERAGGRVAPEPGPGPARAESPVDLAEGQVPEADTVEPTAQRTAVAPVALAEEQDPELAEIRGRFVLAGGAPAAGVAFEVHGWQRNDEAVQKYGLPEHWEDLTGETDAGGRFSVRFEPPRAYQFTFDGPLGGDVRL